MAIEFGRRKKKKGAFGPKYKEHHGQPKYYYAIPFSAVMMRDASLRNEVGGELVNYLITELN